MTLSLEVSGFGVRVQEARTVLEREFFIDNLLVRIHLIIETSLVDRPCAIELEG